MISQKRPVCDIQHIYSESAQIIYQKMSIFLFFFVEFVEILGEKLDGAAIGLCRKKKL
jgi:hypothetical protein